MALKETLLEVLVCPKCKGELEYNEQEQNLVCHECKLAYRIEEDIPVMLIEEARPTE